MASEGRIGRTVAGFEARCAWCGTVPVGRDDLLLHVGSEGGMFEFRCPECERVNLRGLPAEDVQTLITHGVLPSGRPAPFELLEDRSGPPIGWDDVIDLHLALAGVAALPGRRGPAVELERDAA